MSFLIDTQALIWYAMNDPRLGAYARALTADPANVVFISPASFWEIAIKISLGKLSLHVPLKDFIDLCLGPNGFRTLSIEPPHIVRLAALPYPPGHKDPFDRLLIAQAIAEGLPIVGSDAAFDLYPVHRLW